MADDRDKKGADKDEAPKKKVQFITVKSNMKPAQTGGDPVALHEKHEDHPDGEVFVYGSKEVKVAKTAAVSAALGRGDLVEV
jgi:hypothetical protein